MDFGLAQGRGIGGDNHEFGVVWEGEEIERRDESEEGERGGREQLMLRTINAD
jgi:hypothetical protein